ncbi:MAG: pilus assembly PilX N-terminal domain-containing protein [Gammaproteobacteria bacterium]|nr:pilus assembly PilX N-terminal domain-containing protein [Gammaproteobacteria bacterium]
MKQSIQNPRKQRGAALVIGLILLLILTLLAVSGMNSASTELIMAGNEQYRQNAFQAAETGVEQALTTLANVPQSGTPTVAPATAVPGSATDEYATSSRYLGDDLNIPGFSAGKFVGFHYEITSTGTSARNARAQHVQGAFVIQSSGSGGSERSINP